MHSTRTIFRHQSRRLSHFRLQIEALEKRRMLAALLPGDHHIPDFVDTPTITSIGNGNWNDPGTWSGAKVPGAADRVKIASGDRVRIADGDVDVAAIGVQGNLEIESSVRVSDVVVYADGHLSLLPGTEVVFADGALDLQNDPRQWGTGLIVQGTWTASGTSKTAYVRATADIPVGAKSFTAEELPSGWQVGDTLLLPETAQTVISKSSSPLQQSETVTIAAIEGRTVFFEEATQFPHHGISPNPFDIQRYSHVANLTRSVVLRSENPDGLRGHTVVTHHAQVDLENVAFVGLGRTSADRLINDTVTTEDGVHIGTNVSGRYPFHSHHLDGSLELTGSVVQDGEKWGITIHQTDNAVISENVVFDTDGAGIATEDASETGNLFHKNLVVKVDGGHQEGDLRGGARQTGRAAVGTPKVEIGADGSGFWFRGPANTVTENFVYDAAGYGFNYNGYYREGGETQQVEKFKDNEVVASLGGFWASWSQSCCNIDRFERQTFEDFLAWHITERGVNAFHEADMTLDRFTIINNPKVAIANQGSAHDLEARTSVAFDFGNSIYENHNLELRNIRASGANIGLLAPVNTGDGATLVGAELQNYMNIAFAKGAVPTELDSSGVVFLPTFVTQANGLFPDEPADVWQQGLGTIAPGQVANGDSGADGDAASAEVTDTLKIVGGDSDDRVLVRQVNENIQYIVNGATYSVPLQGLLKIEFQGHGGNDRFENRTGLPSFAAGGLGNDTLIGGSAADTLRGQEGHDRIFGNGGDDILYGNEGNDELHGGDGVDRIRGAQGDDLIFGGLGSDHVLDGGEGNDRIDGGDGNDRIFGRDGTDTLLGGAGDDFILGGNDDDLLFGEAGNDRLFGDDSGLAGTEIGNDQLVGGLGVDRLRPGRGNDAVFGSQGDIYYRDDFDQVFWFSSASEELAAYGIGLLQQIYQDEFDLSEDMARLRIRLMHDVII